MTNDKNDDKRVEVKSPDAAQKEAVATTKESNSQIEKAAAEAAKLREADTKDLPKDAGPKSYKESFNTTDSILGRSEDHGDTVQKAQEQSVGDPDEVVVTTTASQNQNNLKHPEEDAYTDPLMAKNYQGQPI